MDEQETVELVSDLKWISRGIVKAVPNFEGLKNDDLMAFKEAEEAEGDTDEDALEFEGSNFFSVGGEDLQLMMNDKYMKKKKKGKSIASDDSSDISLNDEEVPISPDDIPICVATMEGQNSYLHVYVYTWATDDFIDHHDYLLNEPPISLEWIETQQSTDLLTPRLRGFNSLCAVGLISSGIEIWDMDDASALEPVMTLRPSKKSEVAVTSITSSDLHLFAGTHKGEVVTWDLRNADTKKAKIDLEGGVVQSLGLSEDKSKMLCACQDHIRILGDTMTSVIECKGAKKPLCSVWHSPNTFVCTDESGHFSGWDLRKLETPLWNIHVCEGELTGITAKGNTIATCGADGYAHIWDFRSIGKEPVVKKNLKSSRLHCATFCHEEPSVIAFGGKEPVIWDLAGEEALCERFCFKQE
eukprot:GHVP01033850.1.p1 GENE.GHVP01033850.1~~GHVP01033850.1.p1  ORF type:complete len:413 (+),score=91.88 GHVP01033850.1:699-1937(+)